MIKNGLIQTYTGSGKSKTTSALGLTFRALGRDWNILIVQFLKGDENTQYGEINTCTKFSKQIKVIQSHSNFGSKIIMEHNKTDEDKKAVQSTWLSMIDELYLGKERIIYSGEQGVNNTIDRIPYDMLVLDEVLPSLCLGLITQKQFFSFIEEIKKDKPNLEIVLTGRMWIESIYDKIKDISDLMSDSRCVKHYFNKHCPTCKRSFEYRSNYCPNCGKELVSIKARLGVEF